MRVSFGDMMTTGQPNKYSWGKFSWAGFRWAWMVAGLSWCLGATASDSASFAPGTQVAEFRADQSNILPLEQTTPFSISPRTRGELRLLHGQIALPEQAHDPWGLKSYGVGGRLETGLGLKPGMTGVLDYELKHTLYGAELYRTRQAVKVGPRFSTGTNSNTTLYYGYRQDVLPDRLRPRSLLGSESDSVTAGVAQTWHFADHRGQLRVGLEYEEARGDEFGERMTGHRILFSGRIPLSWGLHAELEADYSRNLYPELNGSLDLASDRRLFKAGVGGALTERLHGNLHYMYADEDFDDAVFSYRRRAWGLNLTYSY